jgi:hypothetical protein
MSGPSTWTDASWRAGFEAWIDEALTGAGERRRGQFQQIQVRPWSTVLQVETDGGTRFAKAGAATQRQEPAVLRILAELDPSLVPVLLAADEERGWSITADAGRQARQLPDADAVLDAFTAVLPRYADLQIAATRHLDALLDAGVPDARSGSLVASLGRALDDADWFEGPFEDALAPREIDELRDRLPQLARLTAELEAGPIAPSIQHDDLHDANLFLGDGGRILDWGDAVIGHPFGSLRVVGIALENRFELDAAGPEVQRLWVAYLEPWETLAPRAELLELARRAVELDAASRALTWTRIIEMLPGEEIAEWRYAPAAWMRELLGILRQLDGA